MQLNRRLILQSLGLTAGSTLFPSLERKAGAQVNVPTRLVTYKDQLIVMDGLDMVSSMYDPNGSSNAHIAGRTHALSGDMRRKASNGSYDWSAITIDQAIAQAINSPTPVTRFPSLELAVASDGDDVRMASNGTGAFLPSESDPERAYRRLFPTPTGTVATMGIDSVAQRRSVLEFAQNRFKTLQPKLSNLDRTRLDAHASAIRDLEARLALVPATPVTCMQDDTIISGIKAVKASGGQYLSGQRWYDAAMDAQLRVAQIAMACDLTRVVSIVNSDPGYSIGYTQGMLGTTDYHDLVHKTDGGIGGPLGAASMTALQNNPDALAVRKRHALYDAAQFAKLLQLMRAVPTADGQTLLDHSVVLWCGHIGWGGHELAYLPWMMAGSAGGYFKTGRFLQFQRVANPKVTSGYANGIGWLSDSKLGQPHNNLFVSLANAMGVPITTFGAAQACTGPLAGLRG
jgi:hypothetical protein